MFKPHVNRRRFLWLGSAFSAGLLSAILARLMRSPITSASPAVIGPQPFVNRAAVGFWQESRQLSSLKLVSWHAASPAQPQPNANLIAAEALTESDRAFLAEGAKVHIQGFRSANNVQSLDVYAHYPTGAEHDAQTVCVWSFRATPILSAAAPVSFVMPVTQAEGLTFSMVWHYRNPDGSLLSAKEEAIAHFALDAASPSAKLQRGVYLFAGRDAKTGQTPEWQRYQLQVSEAERDDKKHQLIAIGQAAPTPATVPYLLVAIDYPSSRVGTLAYRAPEANEGHEWV